MIGSGGQEIDHAAERIDAMQRRAGAFKNLNRVHRLERNGQVEIVVRGLAVVDAEAIEQYQGLLKAASAQHEIGLRAAGAALFEKDGRVLAQKIERSFGGQLFAFERQNLYGARRLGKRHGSGGAEHHHGFGASGDSCGLRRRRALCSGMR